VSAFECGLLIPTAPVGGCAVTVLPASCDIFRAASGPRSLNWCIWEQTAGSFQQGASGTLGVTFAGMSPGTGFGQLTTTGPVKLAGTLAIGTSGGFTPPKNEPFEVLGYDSRSGKFGKLSGSPAYTVSYHATSMDVVFR
jgi:hypothetical protein